jgi:post-segregation antitoxin (ccd killing protein)
MSDDLRALVTDTFRATIKNGDYPPDLKSFLLKHERRAKFFNNLVTEFTNPKLKNLTREKIESMVRETTEIFVLAAKRRADELNMSKIKQGMIKAAESKKAEMRKLSEVMDAREKENVTQDKAGNETSTSTIDYDHTFV